MQQVSGKVIRGEGYGKQLGFPTVNLDRREYSRKKLNIRLGVWAGYVKLPNADFRMLNKKKENQKSEIKNQEFWKAGIVVGPIDASGFPKLEAHLIGFKGIVYNRKTTFYLLKYLRPFRKFESAGKLKRQIIRDIQSVKKAVNYSNLPNLPN